MHYEYDNSGYFTGMAYNAEMPNTTEAKPPNAGRFERQQFVNDQWSVVDWDLADIINAYKQDFSKHVSDKLLALTGKGGIEEAMRQQLNMVIYAAPKIDAALRACEAKINEAVAKINDIIGELQSGTPDYGSLSSLATIDLDASVFDQVYSDALSAANNHSTILFSKYIQGLVIIAACTSKAALAALDFEAMTTTE